MEAFLVTFSCSAVVPPIAVSVAVPFFGHPSWARHAVRALAQNVTDVFRQQLVIDPVEHLALVMTCK